MIFTRATYTMLDKLMECFKFPLNSANQALMLGLQTGRNHELINSIISTQNVILFIIISFI